MNAAGVARDACAGRQLSSIFFDVPMTVKRLTFCAVLFLLFVLGVTWFWLQLFDTRARCAARSRARTSISMANLPSTTPPSTAPGWKRPDAAMSTRSTPWA